MYPVSPPRPPFLDLNPNLNPMSFAHHIHIHTGTIHVWGGGGGGAHLTQLRRRPPRLAESCSGAPIPQPESVRRAALLSSSVLSCVQQAGYAAQCSGSPIPQPKSVVERLSYLLVHSKLAIRVFSLAYSKLATRSKVEARA